MGPATSKPHYDNPQKIAQQIVPSNVVQNVQDATQTIDQTQAKQSSPSAHLEPFVIAWVDQDINGIANRHIPERLLEVNAALKTFGEAEEFKKYLQQCTTEKIVLITSGTIGNKLVPEVHSAKNLVSILIFCFKVESHEEWAKPYPKISDVVSDKDKLLENLRNIRTKFESLEESKSMEVVLREIPEQAIDIGQMSVFWFQFFLQFLLHSQELASYDSFDDLILTLNEHSAEDKGDKDFIENFRINYRENQAISWLLRDGPFKRLVRQALLEYDVQLLFPLRFLLADAEKQLKMYQARGITVYRYIPMSKEQMEHLKVHPGQPLVINNFLSASTDPDEINPTVPSSDSLIPVRVQIKAEAIDGAAPFAILSDDMGLSQLSLKGTEVLFMAGATFEIGPLLCDGSNWTLKLTLIDHRKCHLFESLYKEYQREIPATFISNLLVKCSRRKKAILFNGKLHSVLSENHGLKPLLSQNIKHLSNVFSALSLTLFLHCSNLCLVASGYELCLVRDLRDYHTSLSSALLEMIGRAGREMVHIDDGFSFEYWRSFTEQIHLFTTAKSLSSSTTTQPKYVTSYVLDRHGKENEKQRTFNSTDRLMLHLVDVVLKNYQRELDEWHSVNDTEEVTRVQKEIMEIYTKVRMIDMRIRHPKSAMKKLQSGTPLLYWLRSPKVDDVEIIDKTEGIFETSFHQYRTCVSDNELHNYVVKNETSYNIFIVIQSSYPAKLAENFSRFSNVYCVLRYGINSTAPQNQRESRRESERSTGAASNSGEAVANADTSTIKSLDDLTFYLTWNLIKYYRKMAEQYQAHKMLVEARGMLVEAQRLCKFLSKTSFRPIE